MAAIASYAFLVIDSGHIVYNFDAMLGASCGADSAADALGLYWYRLFCEPVANEIHYESRQWNSSPDCRLEFQVCEILQVSSATLWRMVTRGDLEPYVGPGGKLWRFSRRDIDAYLDRLLAPYQRFRPPQ